MAEQPINQKLSRFKEIRSNKKIRIGLIIFVLSALTILFIKSDFETIKNFIRDHQILGIAVSLLLYILFGVFFIPTEPLTIFLGALMGVLQSVIICIVGNTLASLIEYYIGSLIGDISDFEKQKENLPLKLGKMPVKSLPFQFGVRAIPGIGSKFASVASGIYKVPIPFFLTISAISNFIGAIFLSYGGDFLARYFI